MSGGTVSIGLTQGCPIEGGASAPSSQCAGGGARTRRQNVLVAGLYRSTGVGVLAGLVPMPRPDPTNWQQADASGCGRTLRLPNPIS